MGGWIKILISEIFRSISGESSYAGKPSVFVRVSNCNLRCNYCDTKYAYTGGKEMTIYEIFRKVYDIMEYGDILIITGGEPLQQVIEVNKLIKKIRKDISTTFIEKILIETNGSLNISDIKWRSWKDIIVVMDWKLPSSGMNDKMLVNNLYKLKPIDELKFVIGDMKDYNEMKKIIEDHDPNCQILVSTIWDSIDRKKIVERMLKDKLCARFQIQLHKLVWNKNKRGV